MCCGTLINAASANIQCAVGISIAYLYNEVNKLEHVDRSFKKK